MEEKTNNAQAVAELPENETITISRKQYDALEKKLAAVEQSCENWRRSWDAVYDEKERLRKETSRLNAIINALCGYKGEEVK